jgi:hypothetical protein
MHPAKHPGRKRAKHYFSTNMANPAPTRVKINQCEQKRRIFPNHPTTDWTKGQFDPALSSRNDGDLDAAT